MNGTTPTPAPKPRNSTRLATTSVIGKICRNLRRRWIHPQTSFYLQAFVDGLVIVVIGIALYEAAMAIQVATRMVFIPQVSFFRLLLETSWLATAFAAATGFSIGSFYDVLKRWKLEEVSEPEVSDPEQATAYPASCRARKFVTLGRLRMPYWLYMTSTMILALGLPAFASIAVREIRSCGATASHSSNSSTDLYHAFQPSMVSFVGAVLFCLIDVAAIVARLVIVMRYLPRLEPTTRGNVEEKWDTVNNAARLA
ncbi:hypothetical protein PG999_004771 [Apiospora kogelbergensis]|uniref:Proteophosphoglycan ppg4 n=1 Tax=Apiospora kogelbergensis TaxID=1337665 RepID=A0AAW0R082_9PEZI